ncbi:YhbY family RNA-binding protein [Guggenheimella bovis]
MLTGKERSFLKTKAMDLKMILQVGKNGATDSFLEEASKALDDHELVKFGVLDTADLDVKECANEIAEKLGAEFVSAIGKKFVLYRQSELIEPKDRIHIPKWK